VFDADFIPPIDFLLRTIHHFADTKVGVVQTRWAYLNRDFQFPDRSGSDAAGRHSSWSTERDRGLGCSSISNGTAGILRRSMIDDAGGWQHDTLTEDSDLSYGRS